MNSVLLEIVFILIFCLGLYFLYGLKKKKVNFTKRVFTALGLSVIFGLILKFGAKPSLIEESFADLTNWIALVGSSYTTLLKMIVVPLIMVSIISAVVNLDKNKKLAKIVGTIIAILIMTTVVSAFVGVSISNLFNLDATEIVQTEDIASRAESIQGKAETVNVSIQDKLLAFLPKNPFADMTGARSTSIIAVVIFSGLIGLGALSLKNKEALDKFRSGINNLNSVVLRVVGMILRLTPYGVFALLSRTIALTNYDAIVELGKFVVASYLALIIMFIIQILSVQMSGVSYKKYVKKVWPVLTFAFVSRSSAATIPLNSKTQSDSLGVDKGIASMSASLGATIGQNG